ncbi:MAG: distal tail protein Dit [Candidatus Kryptoniota bacterium]
MLSFVFNGKDSYKDYGILMEKRPNIPSPKRRVQYIDIPGRDSSLRYDEETYEDITLSVECAAVGNIQSRIDDIKAWLIGSGESDLIFSYQSDKKYIAQVVNSIDFEIILKVTSRFVIIFNCKPFKYSVMNEIINITSGTGVSLFNPGTIKSRPLIKAYCSGNGTFAINNREVRLIGIDKAYVAIDSELEEAYFDEEGTLLNANNHMFGEYPLLDVGSNIVTFSGGVFKLEIIPNWRWL